MPVQQDVTMSSGIQWSKRMKKELLHSVYDPVTSGTGFFFSYLATGRHCFIISGFADYKTGN
jgi:hypothetical protein